MIKILRKDIHHSWFLVWFCVGIIIGIIVGLFFRINFFTSISWVFLVALIAIFTLLKPKAGFLIFILISGVILAFFRISGEIFGDNYIRQFYGKEIIVAGTIEGDPETDDSGTKVKLNGLRFGREKEIKGNLYLHLRQNKDIKRSDFVTIRGKLAEGFRTFNGYMYKPTILGILRPEPGDLVLKVRDWFSDRIIRLIPEPEVNLGLSYLLGMKTGLSDEMSDNLRIIGLVHIVVASGAHLSILVEVARKIFGKISRFSGLLFSILFIIFFMAMVGFTPSILRAGIMSILTLIAWYVGRKFAPWRIILITMALTLMINPNFIFNLGWLLSFASFFGILVLGPILAKFFYGEKKPSFISSIILTTISATLMTLPIILYFYGTVSLISVFANLLILPTLSFAMGLVFLTGVFSGVLGIGEMFSFFATKLLEFHIFIVSEFGKMKNFLIQIEKEQIWFFGFYFIILFIILISYYKNKKKRDL